MVPWGLGHAERATSKKLLRRPDDTAARRGEVGNSPDFVPSTMWSSILAFAPSISKHGYAWISWGCQGTLFSLPSCTSWKTFGNHMAICGLPLRRPVRCVLEFHHSPPRSCDAGAISTNIGCASSKILDWPPFWSSASQTFTSRQVLSAVRTDQHA